MQTTIAINVEIKEKLKQFGTKGQTYEEIIASLMEIAKMHAFLQKQKSISTKETFEQFEADFEPVTDEKAIKILDKLETQVRTGKRKTTKAADFFKKYGHLKD